jgi:sec-independent protein translocase protein TatA
MTPLLLGGLGAPELLVLLGVLVLLFGANKLPELAKGSGQALRIFKAEIKEMGDDDVKAAPVQTAPVIETAPIVASAPIVETVHVEPAVQPTPASTIQDMTK